MKNKKSKILTCVVDTIFTSGLLALIGSVLVPTWYGFGFLALAIANVPVTIVNYKKKCRKEENEV